MTLSHDHISHTHQVTVVFIFFSSSSISCMQQLGLLDSLSIAFLNTRKPQTGAGFRTFKAGWLTGLLTSLPSSCQTPYVCPLIWQRQVNYWENAWTEGQWVLFLRLNQVCDLIVDWWPPHDIQQNTQAGFFCKLLSSRQPWPPFGRGCCARWLQHRAVYFCKLVVAATLQAVTMLSCFPIRHALCNPPACYEHEINKTLGHH